MLVKKEIPGSECDRCPTGKGEFAYVVAGATGRWCEIMWACSRCVKGQHVTELDKAREFANNNGYADF